MHTANAAGTEVIRALQSTLSDVKCLLRELIPRVATEAAPGALSVLAHLNRSGPQRAGRIAEEMSLDPSVVSRHVKALYLHGYVQRRPEIDGRAYELALTPAGSDLLSGVLARIGDEVMSVLSTWRDEDLARFAGYLDRLHAGLASART